MSEKNIARLRIEYQGQVWLEGSPEFSCGILRIERISTGPAGDLCRIVIEPVGGAAGTLESMVPGLRRVQHADADVMGKLRALVDEIKAAAPADEKAKPVLCYACGKVVS